MKSRKARIFSIALALVVTLSLMMGCAKPTPAPTAAPAIPTAEIQEAIGEIDEGVSEALVLIKDIGERTDTLLAAHPGDEKIVPFQEKMEEVKGAADALHECVEKLGELAVDPVANEAALKETVIDVAQRSNELMVLVDEAHDLVHPVMFKYEEEGGTELHDLIHTGLAKIIESQEDVVEELATLLGATIQEFAAKPTEETEEVKPAAVAPEYQENIEELTASAKELKELINNMSAPAHGVPGDAGASIHTQFHRCEGFALAIYDSVETFEELAADPEKNKEEMRELVVVELWDQLGSEMFGGLAKAVSGMSEFIEQALAADAEDANALECHDILDEVADAQDTILEQVGDLAAKVQAPIVWEYSCMGPLNSSRLANGNTLINETFSDRVIEVSPAGEIVWEYTEVVYPTDSERLENGNTLIADKGNKRVIEVTPDKEIVWEYLGGGQELTALYGVRALDNGNVLIAEQGNMQDPASQARIIEVTPDKEVVWEYSDSAMVFQFPTLGERLANGNTLIADNTGMFEGKDVHVREVTPDKEIAWEYSEGLTCVAFVHRLATGNTLINAQCDGRIIEVTSDGEIVWMYGAINMPGGMRRLANGNTLIGVFGENQVIEVAAP